MPRILYKKKKERLVLALRIKNSNLEAELYSYHLRYSRYCLINCSESLRCSVLSV